jgi:phage N-6-adenine-methyltransferase
LNRREQRKRRGRLRVHFSSATDDWATPPEFFQKLNDRFGPFDLDVCATPSNAKCGRYYTNKENGLEQEWVGRCWMNPPYGREIGSWMKKAWEASKAGALVVCLVPARTDTAWWHNYAQRGKVEFIRGRLKFGAALNSAPFPSAVVVFNPSTINYQPSTT